MLGLGLGLQLLGLRLGCRSEPSPESLQLGGFTLFQESLNVCAGRLVRKNSIYSISYFNLWGAWSFVGWGAKPTKDPHSNMTVVCLSFSYIYFLSTKPFAAAILLAK